ncbi:MAG: copper resistance protein CopC [Pseudonocardiales bacterium]|nr:copper resistance protein CopC [Pseudonocardiales bacterium]
MAGLRTHRVRIAAAVVLGALCAMLAVAPSASAHAVLESSTPSSGQLIPTGSTVGHVELRFDEPVEAAFGAIQVVASDGSRVDVGTARHPQGASNRVDVAVRSGVADGSYLVVWRVVSADSHPVHGSYVFSVGRSGPVADAPAATSGRPLALALGFARFAGYAGLLLLVGAVAFFALCQPFGWAQPAAGRRLIYLAVGVAAVADVAGLGLQAAFDVAGGWSRAWDPSTLSALLGTRLGHAHLVRLAVLLAVLITIGRVRSPSRPMQVLVAGEVLAAVGTVAAEGHGGVSPAWAAVDALHVTAAGTWLGGLVVLSTIVIPTHRRARTAEAVSIPGRGGGVAVLERPVTERVPAVSVHRFSAVALGSVAVLVGTGVAQALRQVPEFGALTGTRYGQLLLVKVGLVALVVAVAAISRSAVHRRASAGDVRTAVLARSVLTETVLLVGVLAVTSALVATTPARAAFRPTEVRTVQAGPVSVQVTVVPSAPRTVDIHLYAFGADGLPSDVLGVEAGARARGSDLGAISVPLMHAGTGHFLANHVLLPRSGTWDVDLVVRTGEFDAYSATTTLTVR